MTRVIATVLFITSNKKGWLAHKEQRSSHTHTHTPAYFSSSFNLFQSTSYFLCPPQKMHLLKNRNHVSLIESDKLSAKLERVAESCDNPPTHYLGLWKVLRGRLQSRFANVRNFALNLSILAHHRCNDKADRYHMLFGGCKFIFELLDHFCLGRPPVNLILGGGEAGCHRVVKIPASDSDQYTGPQGAGPQMDISEPTDYPRQLTGRPSPDIYCSGHALND